MSFYDSAENVDKYIEMCEGYDGSNLHELLSQHLKNKSSLLELGCGAGNDIAVFKKIYNVTGSDNSLEFLSRCKLKYPDVDFVQLDAFRLNIDKRFNCIFSNKVLHHLSEAQLRESLKKQSNLLSNNGVIAHSFWLGEGCDEIHGLRFNYYSKEQIMSIVSEYFNIIDTINYQEFKENDSLFIVAQKVA
ncbi:trans-aconitate 2-methyltransferase [Vibrio amylolyticus]|uniref:class I SAM-dependent methyltransferase n=1 Tax=Vibrio amylolyticus TaxID=2847292 RepID=UPI00354B4C89